MLEKPREMMRQLEACGAVTSASGGRGMARDDVGAGRLADSGGMPMASRARRGGAARGVALSAAVVGARRGAARGTGARPGLTRVVRLTRGGHTSLTNSSTPRESSMPAAAQVETLRCSRLRRFYGSLQSNSSNMCRATHLRDGHVQATSYSNSTLLSV